jgi:hypothetical protein
MKFVRCKFTKLRKQPSLAIHSDITMEYTSRCSQHKYQLDLDQPFLLYTKEHPTPQIQPNLGTEK